VIGGTIVAAFSFFFFGGFEAQPDLELEYRNIEYGPEIYTAQLSKSVKAIREVIDATGGDLDKVKDDEIETILGRGNSSLFGSYGYIELVEIVNNEANASAEILIEGRRNSFTIVDTMVGGTKEFSSDFSEVRKLLPNERAKIISVVSDRSNYSLYDNKSHVIFVSSSGSYLAWPDTYPNIIEDLFGKSISKYPFSYFVLIMMGSVLILIIVLQAFIAVFLPELRIKIMESMTSDKELSFYSSVMERRLQKRSELARSINESKNLSNTDQ
jgi:hypothetical protein